MPISSNTIRDLKKTTAQFEFLLTAPNIKLKTIPADNRLCVICQEPFDNNNTNNNTNKAWNHGAMVNNRPVKLDCGHILGLQCLAHLVFTSDLNNNRCPLCRAPIMSASFHQNPSAHSWKTATPLFRLLMMFGGGGDRATFARKNALDVLQNGLEKEGLVAPAPGKHMHRVMVLYEEFLNRFCDDPEPPAVAAAADADADAGGQQQARVQELRDLVRELESELERSRVSATRRVEIAESGAEEVLGLVREDYREVEGLLRDAREEVRVVRRELRGSEEEVQEVERRRVGLGRELEGVYRELREARGKAGEELECAQKELNEVVEKARKELESAEERSKDAMEKALQSLKAKVALAWFCFRLSLIGVVFILLWVYF